MGTVLAAECKLLLDAPERRGKLRSSEAAIVASYSCWKPMFLVGRLIGVCSPLTSMQNLGSQPVFEVGSARWPDGPPQSAVAHGFGLIPVSGVGEVASDEKIGGNGVEGTFNKDMTSDEMTFSRHTENRQALSQTRNHMWRAQRDKVRVCAYGKVLSVQTPRKNDQAAGDRLRFHHQRFEELSNEIQVTKACETLGFMKNISIGMY